MEEEKNGADKSMTIDKFITGLIGYQEQIKQLKASEVHYKELAAALQQTLNKYQTIVAHLPQKVFLKDKNLFYLFGNENYARLFGVAPQEIPGKTDHDFFPSEVAEQRLNDDRMFLGKGQPEEKEERVLRDGKERVERVVKYPLKDESGEIVGIMGISWDLTENKEKEEALEKRVAELADLLEARNAEWKEIQEKFQWEQAERRGLEEKLRSLEGSYGILFENTGTAIAVIEDNRVISRINTEFENFFGYSRAEVEGAKNWNEFIHNGYPENRGEPPGSADVNFLDPGMRELKVMDKHNKKKTVSITAARIPDTNKVLVSLKDVTKYTQAREELNRVMKQFMELMVEMEKGVKDLDG
jgi:PAS domain S-box-containing protein